MVKREPALILIRLLAARLLLKPTRALHGRPTPPGLVTYRDTGQPRRLAFVEMTSEW